MPAAMQFIREQKNLKGKRVLLRSDFDDPHKGSELLDDYRIRMSLATIEFLHKHGAKIIIISKMGRPKEFGDVAETLLPAAKKIAELLDKKLIISKNELPPAAGSAAVARGEIIFFSGDIREQKNLEALKNATDKEIIILENIRYYPQEEACDHEFAKKLASLGDIYVQDAFAMAHRNEASLTLLPEYLPAFVGLNFEKELKALGSALTLKKHPFVVLIGGAKISDKIGTIKNLGKSADRILIGGGPANLFLLAKGFEIGKSICEKNQLAIARELLRNFKEKLILPADVIVAREDFSHARVCAVKDVKKDEAIFDIGPQTILEFSKHVKSAKKMLWSGPLGLYENKTFSHGTISIAEVFASKCKGRAFGLIGGGDTLSAFARAKVIDQVDFVSTGGSAMLQFLAGEKLPGVEALQKSALRHK
jgi:phosphoglycerate kinase